MANQANSASSIISLPKGGGAMHGLGEKFSPDLFTGTGNFTIPVSLPPGRNGFQPQINLTYSTGLGNSPFGLGWGLSIPGVSRLTSKGIPKYDEDNDVYVLSGAEDLVPVKQIEKSDQNQIPYTQFRPRTEGLFARIRYYRDGQNAYWEVKTKDGLTSLYGLPGVFNKKDKGESGTLIDPSDPSKIFAWKLIQTTDPFGNIIKYTYDRHSDEDGPHLWDQLYLTKIEYVNYGSGLFLVSVDFEYDKNRSDPFSEYKSGYEIRTQWRLNHILVKSHPSKPKSQISIRKYYLSYDNSSANGVSLLQSVLVKGFDDEGKEVEEMPPLEFRYSRFDPVLKRDFFPVSGTDLPAVALTNPDFEIADLTGNGLPDIFQLNGVARFWKNLGNGSYDLPRSLRERPPVSLSDPGVHLMDADGDGRIDLMVTDGAFSGFYSLEHGHQPDWDHRSFQKFKLAPSFNLKDPEVKWLDLTGDGITDVIRSGSRFECFFFHPQQGWHDTRFWPRKTDLSEFPDVNFSDFRIKWGDMSGDTMQDLLLVYDGNVEYYPNLGYGHWGKRIHMRKSPRFPFGYDPRRILIGDVDGDGLADLIYVDDRYITLWINQSGNSWSEPIIIPGTPAMSDQDSVRLIDLNGSGVAGILWSTESRGDGRPHMFFLDLTGGGKPYVLNGMVNNIGSITKVEYTSSSEFYLLDEKERTHRWQTSLPMPVQVVKKVEVIDDVSQTKLTTSYRYHHGYWDGLEREFRGFGMVEQTDTLEEAEYNKDGVHSNTVFDKVKPEHFSPPIRTKTWFHQGPIRKKGGEWIEADYSSEYWSGDPGFFQRGQMLNDLLRGSGFQPHEKRDALRVLRGSILRTELFALDGTEFKSLPYTITESRYDVKEIDVPNSEAKQARRKRIFFPHAIIQRTTQWERGDDPMTQFVFTREYDNYGQLLAQIQIACYRGWKKMSDKLGSFLSTYTRTIYASPNDSEQTYIRDRVAAVKQWEITDTRGMILEEVAATTEQNLKEDNLISHTINYYDDNAYIGLPWKQIGKYGAIVRTENLMLTRNILNEAYNQTLYNGKNPAYFSSGKPIKWTQEYPKEFQAASLNLGYVFYDGSDKFHFSGYYINTSRKKYDFHLSPIKDGRGLLLASLDPLADRTGGEPTNHKTEIKYDDYDSLPNKVIQVMSPTNLGINGLIMEASYNYRVFQPESATDPNGNKTEFAYSPLGLLTATWLRGKGSDGDLKEPSVRMEYNFLQFKTNQNPIWVRTIKREYHDSQNKNDKTIESYEYSDGFGRIVQTRTQAEEEIFGDELFESNIMPSDQKDEAGTKKSVTWQINKSKNKPNVVVSGWQVFDNKGQIIEKFEPFFDKGWDYERPSEDKIRIGKSIQMRYDPRGHLIRTINPDGSEQRVIYGIPKSLSSPDDFIPTPWEVYTYDPNDLAAKVQMPGRAPASHHYTPSNIEIDPLGRTILSVQRLASTNTPGDTLIETLSEYDIRGNLRIITDAMGRKAFKHQYDLANHPLLIDSIDAGIRTTVYDAAGNSVERRDQREAIILQSYDDLNRPYKKWARNKSGESITLREWITYGESSGMSNPKSKNIFGKPWTQKDEAGLISFHEYDFKGNLLKKERKTIGDVPVLNALNSGNPFVVDWDKPPVLDQGHKIDTEYDALNRVMKIIYPEDVRGRRKELIPIFNSAGALEKVNFDNDTYVEHIAYNAKGQRILIAYGNNIMTRHAYDPFTFRLVRLRTEKYIEVSGINQYKPAGHVVQDFTYTYDLAGNILSIHDTIKGSGAGGGDALLREFSYDAIYRLRSASGRECNIAPPASGNSKIDEWILSGICNDPVKTRQYEQHYDYDKMGNMTLLRHKAVATNNYNKEFVDLIGSNRLKHGIFRGVQFNYQYDNNGNLVREDISRHYEWDHSDRLVRFRIQSGRAVISLQASYLYDASGMRVKKFVLKQSGDWESRTYIDGLFECTLNKKGERNNHLHIMDNQSRIAIRRVGHDMGDTWPEVQYHIGDHLGSSNVVIGGVNSASNFDISMEEYFPYGCTSFGDYANKRYRYSGKEKDEESGLYYYGARYYSGWSCKWVSCDKSYYTDSSNLYLFNKNNSLSFIDKIGNQAELRQPKTEGNVKSPPDSDYLKYIPSVDFNTYVPYSENCFIAAKNSIKLINERNKISYGLENKEWSKFTFIGPGYNDKSNYKDADIRKYSDLSFNSGFSESVLKYIKAAIDEGMPLLVGVNQKGEVNEKINEKVTDHFLVLIGYKFVDGRLSELFAMDNAVGKLSRSDFENKSDKYQRAFPTFKIEYDSNGNVVKIYKPETDSQFADGYEYQLSQVRIYKSILSELKVNNSPSGPRKVQGP